MDWTAIEELSMDWCREAGEVNEKVLPHLHSLRKLESTRLSFIKALPNNTLTHLTWIGPHEQGDLVSILEHQGRTLEELELRSDEINYSLMRNKFDLSIIPEMAPNLTRLSINIPRNGSWPLDSLQKISLYATSSFPY